MNSLIFSTILTLFLTTLPFSLTQTLTPAAIFRDGQGNPVLNGGSYAIRRDMMAPDAGSLSWKNTTKSCPLYIIEGQWPITQLHEDQFLPPPYTNVTITSPLKSTFIPLNSSIQISFNDQNTPCKKPLKWGVKPIKSSSINAFYLVAGYDDDNTKYKGSFKVVDSNTKIKLGDYVYRLEYCFDNLELCLQVGNSNMFPDIQVFGATTNPNVNFGPLDFFVTA